MAALVGPDRKIMTAESNIVRPVDFAQQAHIDPDAGFDYADGVQAMVEQGANVIYLSKIQDERTAVQACRAARAGVLVFAGMDCDRAFTAMQRLLEYGVKRNEAAEALACVLSQRLLRTICPKCKSERKLTDREMDALGLKGRERQLAYFAGKGCNACFDSGFHGRRAVIEMLAVTREVRQAMARADNDRLVAEARRAGWRPLRQLALERLFAGETTGSEVLRETQAGL